MAERRMFARRIITSDDFCELPIVSRMLYINMNLEADDEGFVGNAKKIMRNCGAKMQHILALIDANYLIKFDSGVYVITHWYNHNQIAPTRRTGTQYIREKELLTKNKCGEYIVAGVVDEDTPLCSDDDAIYAEEIRKEKERKEEKRKGQFSIDKRSEAKLRGDTESGLYELSDTITKRRTELGIT